MRGESGNSASAPLWKKAFYKFWHDLTRKGDPRNIPSPFSMSFEAGWVARGEESSAIDWTALEIAIRKAKFVREEFPVPCGFPSEIYPQLMDVIRKALNAEGALPSDHLGHMQKFLLEMYQTMVDPVEEFDGYIEGLCDLLLKRAREDREALQGSVAAPKAQPDVLASLKEFLALRQACIDVGGTEGPLDQELIKRLAEMQIGVVDRAKAAIANYEARARR